MNWCRHPLHESTDMTAKFLDALDLALESQPALGAFKDCLKSGNAFLNGRFLANEGAEILIRDRSDFVDQILIRAWRLHLPQDASAALIAVGGYGRREMHPASDVDLLILTQQDPISLEDPLGGFTTFLWDIGLEPGHSVRTIKQCVSEAEQDLTVMTNLVESRFITGTESLYDQLDQSITPDKIWPSHQFFEGKWREQTERHKKYGGTAYGLEPNIKENPGGLRDIQMIGWVAKRHFRAECFSELVAHKFLTEIEYQELMQGQRYLWKIRYALHLISGRHEDRLLFDHQRAIASQFGFKDEDQELAVEQFMHAYFKTVIQLNRLNDMLLQLFKEALLDSEKPAVIEQLNRRFQVYNDYIEVIDQSLFLHSPISMLELFLLMQQHRNIKGIRANTIRLLRAHTHLIDQQFRDDIRAKSLFMEILRQPDGVNFVLSRMNRYEILAAYIPAFAKIVGRMQYDLYHIYTVDEHSLMLLRNLRRFSVEKYAHEFPLCSRIFHTIPKTELLYITGLFHDIAKGRGGDHSTLGAVDAYEFCTHHELSTYDANTVSWLVTNHLQMSMTAQKKDLEDPEVIQDFAQVVGSLDRLDYLYLLTVADMRATNPELWNSWKDSLLKQLYNRTRHAIAQGLEEVQVLDELIQQKQEEAIRQLVEIGHKEEDILGVWIALSLDYFQLNSPSEITWQTDIVLTSQAGKDIIVELREDKKRGCTEVFTCIPNRDNLFSQTVTLLNQCNLDIKEAHVEVADNGCTMNSYYVLDEQGEIVNDQAKLSEIQSYLQSNLTSENIQTFNQRTPRTIKHFEGKTQVEVSHELTKERTMLSVETTDRPGLLSKIGQAFTKHNVRLHSARISTNGAMAEDQFFISDKEDKPIQDQALLSALSEDIITQLDD